MSLFSSPRERRLWTWLLVILVAIYTTLGYAPGFASALRDRNALTGTLFFASFVTTMIIAILFIKKRPGRAEIAVGCGILVTILMAFLRIGTLEERAHLFEYGLVAALVHEALLERRENGRRVHALPLVALIIAVLLGWLDEGIQALLPNRVYDVRDVLFNSLAAMIVIAGRWGVTHLRNWLQAGRQR